MADVSPRVPSGSRRRMVRTARRDVLADSSSIGYFGHSRDEVGDPGRPKWAILGDRGGHDAYVAVRATSSSDGDSVLTRSVPEGIDAESPLHHSPLT